MRAWVDTHVWRISIRLGLIGKKVTADAAHDLLQALLPNDAGIIYNFHKALLRHGQRICVFERPRCSNVSDHRSMRLLSNGGKTTIEELEQPVSNISKPRPMSYSWLLDFSASFNSSHNTMISSGGTAYC